MLYIPEDIELCSDCYETNNFGRWAKLAKKVTILYDEHGFSNFKYYFTWT